MQQPVVNCLTPTTLSSYWERLVNHPVIANTSGSDIKRITALTFDNFSLTVTVSFITTTNARYVAGFDQATRYYDDEDEDEDDDHNYDG